MCIKRVFVLGLLAGILILTGCSKGEVLGDNLPSGKLVSLKVPANFYSGNDLSYFFVNSMEGKLLNSKELLKSNSNVFEVSRIENGSSPRYNFSRFFAYASGSTKYITIYTYIGMLPLSKEFTTTGSSSTSLGNAYVKFTNVPAYTSFILACAYSNQSAGTLSTSTFSIPLYSDKSAGLFIKLKTSTGELYKFVDGLIAGQTTTISLAGMSSAFGSQNISCNSGNFNSALVTIDKYINNDFTSSSFSVFSSSIAGTPPSAIPVTYPSTFLPSNFSRLSFTGSLTGGSSTLKTSYNTFYSSAIPSNLNILDGTFSLTGKYPNSISYTMNVKDKVDAVVLYWAHSSSFRSTNGFGVNWIVYVSPSVREFELPDIPADILSGVTLKYGISNLKLSEMSPTSASVFEYQKAQNFDEWMKNYWFGWGNPSSGQADRYLNFNTSGVKKSALPEDMNSQIKYMDRDSGF